MVVVILNGPMAVNTKEICLKIIFMALANSLGKMEDSMRDR